MDSIQLTLDLAMSEERQCTRCGETKALPLFARKGRSPVYFSECKVCRKKGAQARYRESHRESVRANGRAYSVQYRADHPEETKVAFALWQEKNREHLAAYRQVNREKRAVQRRGRYRANPEKGREDARKWREMNPEKAQESVRRYGERNSEAIRERQRAYHLAHPEVRQAGFHRYRARLKKNGGSFTASQWKDLKAHYGNRCLCCGKHESEVVLSVDHIVPISKGGPNVIENIQPLCRLCNCRKNAKTIDYRPKEV